MAVIKHILIVDDEPNIRLVFRIALEAEPSYRISAEADGESALRALEADPADLILLDLQMPGGGGMEALERLRMAGLDVPVVIVTAHGSVPDAVRAMKLGAIDFLTKPIAPDELRGLVAEVLRRDDRDPPPPALHREPTVPVTVGSQFAENLRRAKGALNRRDFEEAEVFLRQAIALGPSSAEAHNLKGVLHELRREHDASYREYRAALKADRHFEPAQHNMRRYYERVTFGKSDVPVDAGG